MGPKRVRTLSRENVVMNPTRERVLRAVRQRQASPTPPRKARVLEPAARVMAAKVGPSLAKVVSPKLTKLIDMLDEGTLNGSTSRPARARRSGSPSTGSSSETPGVAGVRSRTLQRRARHRMGKYLEDALSAHDRGMSFLAEVAVGPKSAKEYRRLVESFKAEANLDDLEALEPTKLDSLLSNHFEKMFFNGIQSTHGAKLLAGIVHHVPRYGKQGDRHLPNAWRCLKGWRRLTPGRSRRPEPLKLWAGIANVMIRDGHPLEALFCMISVSSYLRPNSLLGLTKAFLVPPLRGCSDYWSILAHPEEGGNPSKTGEFDLSLRLDSAWFRPVSPLLSILKEGDPQARVFPFDYFHYLKVFKTSTATLKEKVVPYQTRHSGASIDRLLGVRSALEVKQRGGWRSDTSVRRYERHARIQHSAARFSSDMAVYLDQCERQLGEMFLRGRTVCPPRT